jgi:hypothetical protein
MGLGAGGEGGVGGEGVLAVVTMAVGAPAVDDGAGERETMGGGTDVAGAEAEALADDASGRLGPSRTPASRGQAIPTTNPIAAMMPTLLHDGRSSDGPGTCTISDPPSLRTRIQPCSLS